MIGLGLPVQWNESIDHFQKYHNTLCFILPKFCISIAFIFSWDHSKSQEKTETMFMQNFGGTNKEYFGIFESGLLDMKPQVEQWLPHGKEPRGSMFFCEGLHNLARTKTSC